MSSISSAIPLASANAPARVVILQLAALAAVFGWAYWPTLSLFADKWINDPQYSHGLLVPFFSGFLVWRAWRDRKGEVGDLSSQNPPLALKPMPILGIGLLVAILGLRAIAGALLFYQLDAASLLLALVAVCIAFGGFPLLKQTGPAIAFLIFMIPLPYELERNVGAPLKTAATVSSTFLLQTLGLPAIRDGNLILIDEVRLGVVDACSGLKMMVTFAAFSVGATLLIQRSRFEKLMILLGIVPVAILSNVLRITATGVSFAVISDNDTRHFLHELYGYAMMLIGLTLLAAELWVLKKLVLNESETSLGMR